MKELKFRFISQDVLESKDNDGAEQSPLSLNAYNM
jgi:hypothetical protein